MKLIATFKDTTADMRKHDQMIDHEPSKLDTQAILRQQSTEEDQSFGPADGLRPLCCKDMPFVGWLLFEGECSHARLRVKSNRVRVHCAMRHACFACA